MANTLTVADYMIKKLITLKPEMDISVAIELFIKHKISGAPVVNDAGEIIGLFSEADCIASYLSCAYNENSGGCGLVQDTMTTDLTTLDANDDIIHAAQVFNEKHRRRIPVLSNGKLVGQISRHDLLKAIHDNGWA